MMEYPTVEEVNEADREQLARWFRKLQPPASGFSYKDENYIEKYTLRVDTLLLIIERFNELGGMSDEIYEKLNQEG